MSISLTEAQAGGGSRDAPTPQANHCTPACETSTFSTKILRPGGSAGGDDVGRYGHGLGIQLTETPSHTAWDRTEITAGMALTIEPSISYGNGFVMVAEENLLVHDDHIELLSRRAPRDLPVI